MSNPTLQMSQPLTQTDSGTSRVSRTSSQFRKRTSIVLHKAIHTIKRSKSPMESEETPSSIHARSKSMSHTVDVQQSGSGRTEGYSGTGGSLRQPTRTQSNHQLEAKRVQSRPTPGEDGLFPFTGVIQQPDRSVKAVPAAPLNLEQQRKYDIVLAHFSKVAGQDGPGLPTSLKAGASSEPLTDWEKLRMLSRESILRYLRATRWDTAAAQKRLTESVAWRREFGVDSTEASDVEEEAKCGKESVLGFDYKARPLHLMFPHRNNTPESPRQMKFAVWILERCIDLMPAGVEQLALLIDFDSKSRNPTSIANAKLMLYILQNHYVERLGVALCINVPWIFKAFWAAIQPFIDPVTKSKCKFGEAVSKEVPSHHLSTEFGGKLDFPYDHDAYWGDLVRTCEKRQADMLERFRTLCDSKIGASEYVILGGDPGHAPGGEKVPGVTRKGEAAAEEGDAPAIDEDLPTQDTPSAQDPGTTNESETTTAQSSEGPSTPNEGVEQSAPAPQLVHPKPRATALNLHLPFFGGGKDESSPLTPTKEGAFAEIIPPSTPMERYRTPVSVLDVDHPLERTFSEASNIQRSNTPGNPVAVAPAQATVDEEREAEEAQLTPRSSSRALAERADWPPASPSKSEEPWEDKLRKRLHLGDGSRKDTAHTSPTRKDSRKDKLDSFFERHKKAASILAPALGHNRSGSTSSSTPQKSQTGPAPTTGSPTRSHIGLPFGSRSSSRANSESGRRGSGIFGSKGRKSTAGSSSPHGETTATSTLLTNGATVSSPEALHPEKDDGHSFPGLSAAAAGTTAAATANGTTAAQSTTVKVLLFASARTAMGGPSELSIQLPTSPLLLSDLTDVLLSHAKEFQGADLEALKEVLGPKGGARWSVGQEMVDESEEGKFSLSGGEEVAIIPPVSGG